MTRRFTPTEWLGPRHESVPAAILVAGLTVALVISLTATNAPDRRGESVEDSKQYLRQMETYGGKATVAATEIRQWFDGLWHGRTLGLTVACLSVLAAAVAYVALAPLPPPTDGDASGRGDRGTGRPPL